MHALRKLADMLCSLVFAALSERWVVRRRASSNRSLTSSTRIPVSQYGPCFTYPLLGRQITVALGPLGSNFVLNGKLQHVNAEQAYTHLTTP